MDRKNMLIGMGALGLAQAHDPGPSLPPTSTPRDPLEHINSMPLVPSTKLDTPVSNEHI